MSEIVLLGIRIALTASLYGFLAWALWLLWRDLKYQQNLLAFRKIPPLSLQVKIGEQERIEHFSVPEITIGRDPKNACVINSNTVSTHHARLSYNRGQWWVEDLKSTNGTLLNQELVTAPTVLAPSDQLQCGEAALIMIQPK